MASINMYQKKSTVSCKHYTNYPYWKWSKFGSYLYLESKSKVDWHL